MRSALAAVALVAPLVFESRADAAEQIHIRIEGGNLQAIHAYVRPSERKWYGEFPAKLVVRWLSPNPGEHRRVRFTCISKGCTFLPADQKNTDDVHPVEGRPEQKEVRVDHGEAVLGVALDVDSLGSYTVRAEPVTEKGERGESVTFQLTLR